MPRVDMELLDAATKTGACLDRGRTGGRAILFLSKETTGWVFSAERATRAAE